MLFFGYICVGQMLGVLCKYFFLFWIVLIVFILGIVVLVFVWLVGWMGDCFIVQCFIDIIEVIGLVYLGFCCVYSKGICVSGWFEFSVQVFILFSVWVFLQMCVLVMGCLLIGGGDFYGVDNIVCVCSLVVQMVSDDGQEWCMVMNSFLFFVVFMVEVFYEQMCVLIFDLVIGKLDLQKMVVVLVKYFSVQVFQQWVKMVLWISSWVDIIFNSVNSFWFINVQGQKCVVCWCWQLQVLVVVMDVEVCKQVSVDFFSQELQQCLVRGLVCWNLVVIIVEFGDVIDDLLVLWFELCDQVVVGVFSLDCMQLQEQGVCGQINFDFLILFSGVCGSNDLILVVCLVVYLQFFNCCECECVIGNVE